jgi:hypothetical protein
MFMFHGQGIAQERMMLIPYILDIRRPCFHSQPNLFLFPIFDESVQADDAID